MHLDSEGIDLLIKELEYIKTKLAENDCPHSHLFSSEWGGWELSPQESWTETIKVNRFIISRYSVGMKNGRINMDLTDQLNRK